MKEVHIKNINGHYEAFDAHGRFIVSGDTMREIKEELKKEGY